jgi:hypothetical protein
MCDALDRFLATPPARLEEMGEAARERARAIDTARVADRFVEAIEAEVRRRRRRRGVAGG